MHIADSFKHAGLAVRLIHDEDAQSPSEDRDDGLFIVTNRNRYFQQLREGEDAQSVIADKAFAAKYHIFPLRMYAHSGVALSLYANGCFGDPWDSGQVGFVFAAKDEWKYRNRNTKRGASARKAAEVYVETWNQYLSGDVYGAVILAPGSDEELESCWGLYGLEDAREEGKSMADGCAASLRETDQMVRGCFAL